MGKPARPGVIGADPTFRHHMAALVEAEAQLPAAAA